MRHATDVTGGNGVRRCGVIPELFRMIDKKREVFAAGGRGQFPLVLVHITDVFRMIGIVARRLQRDFDDVHWRGRMTAGADRVQIRNSAFEYCRLDYLDEPIHW